MYQLVVVGDDQSLLESEICRKTRYYSLNFKQPQLFHRFSSMISVERHGTVGRTYEEDDEVLTAEINTEELVSSISIELVVDSLVISADSSSSALVSAMISSYDLRMVGSISGKTSKSVFSNVYHNSTQKLSLITVEKSVPPSIQMAWLRSVFNTPVKFVLSLASLNIASFHGDLESNGTLRKLQSSATSLDTELNSSANCVKPLEIGNISTGTGAAVLAHCEARSIPSILLLSVTSASRTMEALRAYEQAWPIFKHLTAVPLKMPTHKDYMKCLRSDPFLSVTENLYC